VGFEPTIPAFERAKTFHVSDRVVTVIGVRSFMLEETMWMRKDALKTYLLITLNVRDVHFILPKISDEVKAALEWVAGGKLTKFFPGGW
jgi:hypothetical protein